MSDRPHDDALLALLYDELPPAEASALREKLAAESPESLERLAEWQAIREVVAELPELEPDPQIHYDIIRAARLAVDTAEKPSRWWAWLEQLTLMPALAGLLLVVLAAGLTVRLSTDMEAADDLAVAPGQATAPATPPAGAPVANEKPAASKAAVDEAKEGRAQGALAPEAPAAEAAPATTARLDEPAEPKPVEAYGDAPAVPTGGADAPPPQVEREATVTDKAGVVEGLAATETAAVEAEEAPATKGDGGKKASAAPKAKAEEARTRSGRRTKAPPPSKRRKAPPRKSAALSMDDMFDGEGADPAPAATPARLPAPSPPAEPAPEPAADELRWDTKDVAAAPVDAVAEEQPTAGRAGGGGAGSVAEIDGREVAQGETRVDDRYAPPPPPVAADTPTPQAAGPAPAAPAPDFAEAERSEEALAEDEAGLDEVTGANVANRAVGDDVADVARRDDPAATLSRARALKARGLYREAVGEFEAFLSSAPGGEALDRVWFETAESYRALGQTADALRFYRLVAGTESPYASRARARIDAMTGQTTGEGKAAGQAAPARARPAAAPEEADALESLKE